MDMESQATRYLIYGRISERGSKWAADESSIPDQIDMCRKWVAFHGGVVVQIVTDEFQSGKTLDRPGMSGIMAQLESGDPPWDVIICRDLYRISRSIADGAALFERLQNAGRGLVAVTQNIDLSSPFGRGMLHILFVIGQMQREESAENVKRGMARMKQAGRWGFGRTPIGYTKDSEKRLVIDPEKADIVRDIFDRFLAGQSRAEIARHHGINSNSVAGMLKSRVYLGHIQGKDELIRDTHPAIIDQDTWNRVQEIIPMKRTYSRPKRQARLYVLQGMFYSPSGAMMTPASANGRSAKYFYYQSTNKDDSPNRVPAIEAEEAVVNRLLHYTMPDDELREKVEAKLRQHAAARDRLHMEDAELAEKRAAIEAEIAQIDTLFLSGVVTPANAGHWNRKLESARGTLAHLQAQQDVNAALDRPLTFDSEAAHIRDQVAAMRADIAKAGKDPQTLRPVIQRYVWRLDLTPGGTINIAIRAGSSIGNEWYTFRSLVEPEFRRVVRRRVAV